MSFSPQNSAERGFDLQDHKNSNYIVDRLKCCIIVTSLTVGLAGVMSMLADISIAEARETDQVSKTVVLNELLVRKSDGYGVLTNEVSGPKIDSYDGKLDYKRLLQAIQKNLLRVAVKQSGDGGYDTLYIIGLYGDSFSITDERNYEHEIVLLKSGSIKPGDTLQINSGFQSKTIVVKVYPE